VSAVGAKIAIIGGGLTGLALAERLRSTAASITIIERGQQLGGLATWHDYGSFAWDRFYHVILPSDAHLLGFLRDIGLKDELRWKRTLTGFYVDRAFHSMSSGLDFLRFPPVSLIGKLRLAFTILYCARIKDWRRLEQVKVGEWLNRLCGRATYEKIWRPLLLAKLGQSYERVSAVFIWSYIKRMFSARDPSTAKEQLGHVSGGYKRVIEQIAKNLTASGSAIYTGVTVRRIEPAVDSGVLVHCDGRVQQFDKVIFTGPTNVLENVATDALYRLTCPEGAKVEYLGVICMVLVTKRALVPYYVVNIADDRIPFTGIIGMSNLVDTQETAHRHITYLPKYVHSDDPILKAQDPTLRKLFMRGLRLMFPGFDPADVESVHINRAVKVQPLQVLGYSQLVPKVTTQHPDFFVLNTAQFAANTLNNNEVIRAVDEFVSAYGAQLSKPSPLHPATIPASNYAEQAI
jgi:protoporphyrinogen oxidase